LFIREVYLGKPGQKSEGGYILRKDTKSLVMLKGFSSGRI
jgi:hypothetical protein